MGGIKILCHYVYTYFSVGSMFVTGSEFRSRRGFDIAVNSTSVKAVYGRLVTMALAPWFLFIAYDDFMSYGGSQVKSGIIYLLLGLIMTALCAYFYFYFGKADENDVVLRTKMGRLTGFYALPNWFDYGTLRNMLSTLELQYKQQYPGENWKTDLQNNDIDSSKHQLLFGLALFNCMVYDLPENDELYARADELFVL